MHGGSKMPKGSSLCARIAVDLAAQVPLAGMNHAAHVMRRVQLSLGAGLPENPPRAGGPLGAVGAGSEPQFRQ